MPPSAFLREPVRWLRAIHRSRGTTAGAPNFAYDLCAERVAPAEREGLDLSGWRVAFNGSEPVRAATLDRFAAAFASQGFRREALFPCYGMAEATLFIAGVDRDAAPRLKSLPDGRRLVGCGRTGPGHEVLIVDPDTGRPRPDGVEGEVWFRGGSVASGYWERSEDTARLFAPAHPGLRPDGAAFVVEAEDRPQLVVVQELPRAALRTPPVDEIGRAVRAAVAREHGLLVAALALLRPGGLPRTSSGKVRRRAAREAFLAGALPLAGESRMGFRPPPASARRPAPPCPKGSRWSRATCARISGSTPWPSRSSRWSAPPRPSGSASATGSPGST